MTAVRTLAPFAMLTIWCAAKLLGFISRIKPNQQMMEKMREMKDGGKIGQSILAGKDVIIVRPVYGIWGP